MSTSRAFTTDKMLHFGSILLAGAWTVSAFGSLAAHGTTPVPGAGGAFVQLVSWVLPVVGLYVTRTLLRMPYIVLLTENQELHFDSVLGRRTILATDLRAVRLDRLGWFLVFRTSGQQIRMLARIAGLITLIGGLREKNPALSVEGL